jgi:hemolysin activation/secretion protein
MFKVGLITAACLCAFSMQSAQAQSSGADALRNIEQNRQALPRPTPKTAQAIPAPVSTGEQGFARLKEISIESSLFQQELLNFWSASINKPVTGQKMSEFKAFAWELFQSKGYLAYINTAAKDTAEGTLLTVSITRPVVGKVSVVTVEGDKGKEYADEVARRFNESYKTGAPVDVAGFEAQLNAMAYDLPVDLDVSMRQVDSSVVDVVINLRQTSVEPGTILGGIVQGNNYGLSQFGRAQALGSIRIAGFTPQSELTLTTQFAEGVIYGRAEYEAPLQGTGMHLRTYIARVKSKANDTKNDSLETGIGFNKLLSADRYGKWTAIAEFSRRESEANASGVQTSFHRDDQVRLRLRAESQKDWVDSFRNEITLYSGVVDLSQNPSDLENDARLYQTAGSYKVLEARGGLTHALDQDRLYTGSIRWVGQLASRNLESYNNMSLGGILGVRAFTTIDGVGDQGLVTQFDLTRQITPSFYTGILYDVGVVRAHKFNLVPTTDDNTSYTLQGAGWQLGGQVDQLSWNFSVAKSFGEKPNYWQANQTVWGSWRANFMTTWAF